MTMNVSRRVQAMIDGIIETEGGFVDDPLDSGGATKYGITESTARRYGYDGDMRDLPRSVAFSIYVEDYYTGPRFDWVAQRSTALSDELTDTGVNMGSSWAVKFLQRALTLLNDRGRLYADITVDGVIGRRTMDALDAFMAARGKRGEAILIEACDNMQGCRYFDLAEANEKNERFLYGWLAHRTNTQPLEG